MNDYELVSSFSNPKDIEVLTKWNTAQKVFFAAKSDLDQFCHAHLSFNSNFRKATKEKSENAGKQKELNLLGVFEEAANNMFKTWKELEEYFNSASDRWTKRDVTHLNGGNRMVAFNDGNFRVSMDEKKMEVSIMEESV